VDPAKRPDVTAFGALAFAIVIWGMSYWPVEVAGEHASPLTLAALRALPAAPLLLLMVPVTRGRLPRGRMAAWAAATGLLMVGVFFYGLTEGTIKAGAGNGAVLANTSPFVVLILARIFLRERIRALAVAGLLIGFAGVVLMVSSQLGEGQGSDVALGMALAFSAAVAWSIGTLVVKRIVRDEPDLDLVGFTAIQYAAGGAALAVLALAVDGTDGAQWGSVSLWVLVALLVLGNSAGGSLAYFTALKRLSATRTAAALFLVPAVAVIVDIARGAAPTALVLVGMALTIAGVALVNLPPGQFHAAGTRLTRARTRT